MSENYCSTDGYRPLLLPVKGEELLEGRQYALTPLARLILSEHYGIRGVPTIVECTKRKVAATRLETTCTNLETGEIKKSVVTIEPQRATFRAFIKFRSVMRFELEIAKLEELEPFYNNSHKLPALEDDWFAQRSLQPTHKKFRGCTLRWWTKGAVEGGEFKPFMKRGARLEKIDLSLLDL